MKFKLFAVSLSTTTFLICIIVFNFLSSTGAVQAGNYGYVNKKGLLLIKSQFSEAQNFFQGFAAVENKFYLEKLC